MTRRSPGSDGWRYGYTDHGGGNNAHSNQGDSAWNYTESAAAAQEVLGAPVRYESLTPEQEHDQLLATGLDEATAGFVGTLNSNIRDGALDPTPGDLSNLIGRPTEPLIWTQRSWV